MTDVNLKLIKKEKLVEAIEKINEIVTRKYIMAGRLSEIHDVIEGLAEGHRPTA